MSSFGAKREERSVESRVDKGGRRRTSRWRRGEWLGKRSMRSKRGEGTRVPMPTPAPVSHEAVMRY